MGGQNGNSRRGERKIIFFRKKKSATAFLLEGATFEMGEILDFKKLIYPPPRPLQKVFGTDMGFLKVYLSPLHVMCF